jgi:hypothetical protein
VVRVNKDEKHALKVRRVKEPLLLVRYIGGASDRSDPPPPEDDSHEIIQVVVAKAPQGFSGQFAGAMYTGGRGPRVGYR